MPSSASRSKTRSWNRRAFLATLLCVSIAPIAWMALNPRAGLNAPPVLTAHSSIKRANQLVGERIVPGMSVREATMAARELGFSIGESPDDFDGEVQGFIHARSWFFVSRRALMIIIQVSDGEVTGVECDMMATWL